MATTTRCLDRPLATLSLFLGLVFAPAIASSATPQFNYLLHCGGCHIEDGSGMGDIVPDLNEDLGYFASFKEGRSYLVRVPGAAHSPLSDADLAEVMNWMLRTFAAADDPTPYSEAEVTANRRVRMNDVHAVRKQLLELKEDASSKLTTAPKTSPAAPAPVGPTQAAEQEAPDQLAALSAATSTTVMPSPLTTEQKLAFGEALFFDTSLSSQGNQACASCHDPGRAFADPRSLTAGHGASIGSDGSSIGHRNAPSLTYVATTPVFTLQDTTPVGSLQAPRQSAHQTAAMATSGADKIRGGFFWDGRETTLEEQVLSPFVNSKEMGLRDLSDLTSRVMQSERYHPFLGTADSQWPESAVLTAIADSLASYLRSDTFNSYDSRYDRFVRGEISATTQEVVGMGLFFSPSFSNCASCHQASTMAYAPREVFSNHRYENIGTPINAALLSNNGLGSDFRDAGLAMNPALGSEFDNTDVNGRFKVPSLRNVAVSAPYMHNGTFNKLDTVMRFYNHYSESGDSGQINPETDQPWAASNNPDGIATHKLRGNFPLSERQLAALTAFLRMLTDQRYEYLLED